MKKNAITIMMAAVFIFSLFSAVALAVNDNSILSQHINEADGTSGQDANSGSGIKTNHIQNNAVTTAKIADSQVTTSKIEDGAVTDAKIAGPISAAKISSAGLNADTIDGQHASSFAPTSHGHYQSDIQGLSDSLADKADASHNHDAVYQKKYAGIAVVAKSGGDYPNYKDAMLDVATWCGTPSATNPCLIKIMPGVYYWEGYSITMSEYVDIEGSGENVTRLSHDVHMASNSEIRSLSVTGGWLVLEGVTSARVTAVSAITIVISGGSPLLRDISVSEGIRIGDGAAPMITNADIRGGWVPIAGQTIGVYIHTSCASLSNVRITGNPDMGVQVYYGSCPTVLYNVTVAAAILGVAVSNSVDMKIDSSSISGSTYSIYEWNSGIYTGNTKLEGGPIRMESGGFIKCVGVYDGDYDPLSCL